MRVNSISSLNSGELVSVLREARAFPACESTTGETQAPEQLAAVLDALDVPLCLTDFQNGGVLYANRPFKARFGEHTAELAAGEREIALTPSARLAANSLVKAHGAPRGLQAGEFEHFHDGRTYLVRAKTLRWKTGQLARLHTLVDITQRTEAERARRAQEQKKVRPAARWLSLDELASTLAHELNQPLGAIGNYVQGAIRRLRAGNAKVEEIIGALEQARLQSAHAAKLVSRMREFVRTRKPRREPINIAELINGIVQLAEPETQKHRVSVHLDLSVNLPLVRADRVMIEQVLLNLAKNGIEAMSEAASTKRELTIRAQVDSDERVEISVGDSGPGLSLETRRQIFSPFFTTKPNGMGIGLALCRSIAECHDSDLHFASPAEGGARFWFTLPRA